MMKALFLVGLCLIFNPVSAEVFETTDDEGNIIYTDIPPDVDSAPLKPPSVNTLPPRKSFPPAKPARKPQKEYTTFTLVSPQPEDTIYINVDNIAIKTKIVPALKTGLGHTLQILFDQKVVAENQLSFSLRSAERGKHTVNARILNRERKTIASTPTITIHVKKPAAR